MASKAELVVPPLGESITEAEIGEWLKKVGDPVAADEPVVELETDKVSLQLTAPAAGVLVEQGAAVGDIVEVGAVVGYIDTSAEVSAQGPSASTAASAPSATSETTDAPAPTPAVASAAPAAPSGQEAGQEDGHAEPDADDIDEELLRRATPAQRRALRLGHDVPGLTRPEASSAAKAAPSASAPGSAPASADAGAERPDEEVVPMSSLRRRIAQRLVQAQSETASLTTFNEVDMSAVMSLRSRYKQEFLDKHGVKLGFLSFFAKACAAAAGLFPGLNAEIRGRNIVYKKHYDFGIAVSTDRGLVVPVLRDVDGKSFAEIERGIIELATKARTGKLTLDDLTGGTFTLTNGGIFGSMLSTPLLNYPQTGILGMHNIVKRPVAVGDQVAIRPVMYLALTYDHRVVDGRQAVQFLVAVKERIESPERLLFEL